MANLSNINNILRTSSLGVGINCDAEFSLDIEKASANAILSLNSSGGSGAEYLLYSGTSGEFVLNKRYVGDRLTISSGGNATFSGEITSGDDINCPTKIVIGESASAELRLKKTNAGYAKVSWYNNNGSSTQQAYISLDSSEDFVIYSAANNDNIFYAGGVLNLTQSGVNSTFAGSVTTGGNIIVNNVGADKKIAFRRTGANNWSIEHDASQIYFYNETGTKDVLLMKNAGQIMLGEYGSGTFTGTVAKNLAVDSSGNIIETDGGVVDGSGTANDVAMWSDSNTLTDAPIAISGNNATFTGNVTISRTGGNDAKLNLLTDGAGGSESLIYFSDTTDGAGRIRYDHNDGSPDEMSFYTASTKRVVIDSSGNVGIGGAPTNQFSIVDGTGANLEMGSNSDSTFIQSYNRTSSAWQDLVFFTFSETMRLTSTGNVGIGTTSPSQLLQVNGNGLITKLGVKAFNAGFDLYNDGTSYFNGATTIDADVTINGLIELDEASGAHGFINTDGTNYEFDINRNPVTGAISDSAKGCARIAMRAEDGGAGSRIIFATAAANNTTATEKMRIDKNGNIGIGTTGPNQTGYSTDSKVVTIKAPVSGGASALELIGLANADGNLAGTVNFMSYAETAPLAQITGVRHTADTAGKLYFKTSGNTVLSMLQDQTAYFYNTLYFSSSGVGSISWGSMGGGTGFGIRGESGRGLSLGSNGAWDKMVIDTNGNVGIGNTGPQTDFHVGPTQTISSDHTSGFGSSRFFIVNGNNGGSGVFQQGSSAANIIMFGKDTANTAIGFYNSDISTNQSTVGSITTTASATAFNTSSDYRLKQDLKDFNGLNLLSKIKVYDFEWKIDNSRSYGVIAHELNEIIPQAVNGEKDAKEMQVVDYSKLVPVLLKSIQELKQEIEILKTKI